jgi:hypothetical protein
MTNRTGAWGYAWSGMGDAGHLLNETPPGWPQVKVSLSYSDAHPAIEQVWDDERAEFNLRSGGRMTLNKGVSGVRLCLPRPIPAECVVQPHLSAAAATFAIWAGDGALHGGAFIHANRAWALVGDKGAGKSSTLGQLAKAGCPILSDDLVVCRRGSVLAGPRSVDLRPDAASALGAGRNIGVVGTRERWRLDVPDAPAATPLGGVVRLGWHDRTSMTRIPLEERLALVLSNGPLPIPPQPSSATLEFAGSPGFAWNRPRDWDLADEAVANLLDELSNA